IQLQHVILNLLVNASQAMRDVVHGPKELILSTARGEGNGVRLSVRDVGVGFAAEDAERLFEGFYSTKSGEMGVGLAVNRTIRGHHGGHLWATRNDGPGATFTFSIPCRSTNAVGCSDGSHARVDSESVVRSS